MGTLQRLHYWTLAHQPGWLVVIRVGLGICLFIKGISFLPDVDKLEGAIQGSILDLYSGWLAIGITWLHLLGGLLIIVGLFTRWIILLQIPVLMGAVFLVNLRNGLFNTNTELLFSAIILLLLILFLIEGGGPFSLDRYFKKHPRDM